MKRQTTITEPPLVPLIWVVFATGAIDTETLELLEAWAREDASNDAEKLKDAQKELYEFNRLTPRLRYSHSIVPGGLCVRS